MYVSLFMRHPVPLAYCIRNSMCSVLYISALAGIIFSFF